MLTPLFDRFEGRRAAGASLARDLEDLLGARRASSSPGEGVLGWGVPIPPGLSPAVESHRECVSRLLARAIASFEPRLRDVRIAPVEAAGEFLFDVRAGTWSEDGGALRLRVLVPRRDGGLGASVLDVSEVRSARAGNGPPRSVQGPALGTVDR